MENPIEQIRSAGHKALEILYRENRNGFVLWAQRQHRCSEDEAREVFQQSMIALYENVTQGRLQTLSSSVKTYLYAVGKHKIMELRRFQGKWVSTDGMDLPTDEEPGVEESLLSRAREALRHLGQPCRGLLIDFYYRGKSMKQLADAYGYKNEATVKTQKFRCLGALRKVFAQLQTVHEK